MTQRTTLLVRIAFLVIFIAALAACGGVNVPNTSGSDSSTATTGPLTPAATQQPTLVVESTILAQPSPALPTATVQAIEPTVSPQATPTATVTVAPEEPTATTPPSTPTATASVTRSAPGIVVTNEPRVDVWTYGTGVVSSQIEGPLQTTIGFLNALILDETGRSSLAYLNENLHATAVDNPSDDRVLGIRTGYVAFEVSWLGASGGASQVHAVLEYEDGEAATHLFELRRNGDVWQITSLRGG